jgi:hypothetical protein
MFFAVKKNSKPRIEKLELATNDFFLLLLQGRKEGRGFLLMMSDLEMKSPSFTPESFKLSEGFAGIWNQCCQV